MGINKNIIIQLQQFEKWYGSVQAVKPMDLEIPNGETFALIGPNGSGKSTIIRALAGLIFPTKGQLYIKKIDLKRNPTQARKYISYMPQRVTMPDYLTAREVITLYAKLKQVDLKRVDEILDFVELKDSADRYIGEYSGGMLQRVGLAVAFLGESDIYVLDEPTLNLDPLGIKRFRELILELKKKGKTILFSSHIIQDAVHLADRVGILIDGKIIRIESVSQFRGEIAKETTVRILLFKPLQGIQKIIESAGAKSVSCNSRSCTFKADPNRRAAVIRKIEAAGAMIEEFHTDPPNWEALLHQEYLNHK
jgi:ABC-type multidrug transport system ATPase subunit